ncbi:MAG: thioredoxin domain-containing protein [Elusimicrobiota bacterium]
MKNLALLFAALLAAPAYALDDAKLLEHLQESYPLPPGITVKLGEPKKSDVPSFDLYEVTFSAGQGSQTEELYVSQNGRHYILGGFKDLKIHPDDERLKLINLKDAGTRGPKDAPIVVVEYTDFQCGFCTRGYRMMVDRVMKDYPKKVRWVYKSMPLVSIHPWAEPAAMAVECAGLQSNEKLWQLHDSFFENQQQISSANYEDKLEGFVKEAGLDKKKFNACYDKQETLAKVNKDAREAGALGISGTPAFVVNGHLIRGANYPMLKQVIEEVLAGKHGKI